MRKEVIVTADKVRNKKLKKRFIKLSLISLLLFLIVIYVILSIIYNTGKFTISLDSNKTLESGIAIFESMNDTTSKRELNAKEIQFMDNISGKWLPGDIHEKYEGSHNGNNYIAYSFYIENRGKEKLNYWYEVILEDVIKRVDEAIRIRIYLNGKQVTYAKKNILSNDAEPDTIKFLDKKTKEEKYGIILETRKDFNPGDKDKMTIVIWLEGDDPECVDDIIGGELKLKMNITEEHIR